ncbi:MAG: quinol dehydrogenase ferredoxin subunit NapH [Helicobacteraceae bacterium]|nr:quinol dehydrogenase ferredoxin subunit NapH [Helicobacteraceae bacterium]
MRNLWNSYRYLFFRRVVQIGLMLLYFGSASWGWTILMGNLSSSRILDFVPLSDPYAVLQMFAAGAVISADLLIGVGVVVVLYSIIGGRAFCSWVCPVNIITDAAAVLRRALRVDSLSDRQRLSRNLRYWILAMSLVISFFMGVAAFEFISPVAMVYRGIVFGLGFGAAAILIIFLFDLFVLKEGWCGHICPLGGFYSLLGKFSLIRVYHSEENCTLCMKCKEVCPEHQVLHMVGKFSESVLSGECTNCARCIEVCDDDALEFSIRKMAENKKLGENNDNIK